MKTELLNNNHKRNLALFILIPLAVFLLWGTVANKARTYVNGLREVKELSSANQRVVNNSDIYDLLKKQAQVYIPVNLLDGIVMSNFKYYFSALPELRNNGGGGGRGGTPIYTPPPEIWPNEVTFVYVGENVNYAVIDGALIKEGGKTPTLMDLVKVEKDRILIKGKRSERWIYLKF